jgi:primase-polymerase (primpol)-like protein
MERLFSRSGLGQRDKWRDRPDYRERTIQKAISDAREFYEPPKENGNGDTADEESGPIELKEVADIEYDDDGKILKVRFSCCVA